MYLIIDNSKSKHTEKYQLFEKAEDAVKVFNEMGWREHTMGMSIDLTPGMMNHFESDGPSSNKGLINLEVNV